MSKSDFIENALLLQIFNGTGITGLTDNTATAPLTNLYVSLHTADPGEAGTQTTSECTYTGYARVAVARTSSGWTVTGNSVSPVANIDFPEATGGAETATFLAVGYSASGAGNIIYSGSLNPTISISAGVTPRIKTATTIAEN